MVAATEPRLAYRIAEASRAIGLSRDVLYKAMRDGKLRFVRAGTVRLIPADALREFLDSLPAEEVPA